MRRAAGIVALALWAVSAFGQTQAELTVSADEVLKKADAELNAVYKEVMASLDDAGKAALKESQRAWVKYRDLCGESEGSMYEGGSIQPMVVLQCHGDLTKEKSGRLRGMLPEGVARNSMGLPSLEAQQAALKKADDKLNKVYKDFMALGPNDKVKEAQRAWIEYRDLCVKAEAAAYEEDDAQVVAAKCATELTLARIERLKGLFMEGYEEE